MLPYGSAFPADAWGAIRSYLERGGNLLNVGGRPLWIPAFREGTGFRLGRAADDYWRLLAAVDATEVPRRDGKPFLVVGVNHWVNDAVFPYFPENGNALEWDRDFAEMASRDLNFVRTGTGSTGSSSSTGPPAARARRCCATSRRSSSPPLATACTCSSRSSRSSLGA